MKEKARNNADKLGFNNVEFRLGDIENIPLMSNVADVVVSNCVMNLVPNKPKAFAEVQRILKPTGHFSISDIVLVGDLPEKIKNAAQSLFTFATYSVGMFIGTNYSGYVANAYNQSTTINGVTTQQHIWETIWLYPAVIASVVLVLFVLFFKEKKQLAAS